MTTPGRNEIRILLVDDHALFREGLVRLLESEPDFKMVACCPSVEEALDVVAKNCIDIVLLDYDLGNERGSEFLAEAMKQGFSGRT